ncbi:MAG: hypothetical protein ACTSRK_17690 [Promethearchaeota archaeon]
MSLNAITFYFTTRVGPEKKQIPFPASPSLNFLDVIEEVCGKFGIPMQTLSLANPAGLILTNTDLMQNVAFIAEKFGYSFELIDQGVVGNRE